MTLVSRGTRAAARPLRQSKPTLRQTSRRNASSHDAHHDAAHGESAHHADAGGTGSEGFGKGFYVTVASIPLLYLTYNLSASKDNAIQRMYQDYQAGIAKKDAQDVLHTKALEQAIYDRSVLYSNKTNHSREIRNQEMFNVGSPWNVAAGEGTADLSKLAAHYEEARKNLDMERVAKATSKQ